MTITINNNSYQISQTWNNLPLKQQLACYLIIMQDTPSLFSLQESMSFKRLRLVQYFCNIDDKAMQEWEKDCIKVHGKEDGKLIFAAELEELMKSVDFLFEETEQEDGPTGYAIHMGLTKCPWPKLENISHTFYAPADELANISFYEMCTAFTIFEDYVRDQDLSHVDRLIATLYRPEKPGTPHNLASGYEGDRRLPLLKHESMVDGRIKEIKTLSPSVKQLILFWFASCRQKIINDYSSLFSQGDEKKNDPGFGWGGVLMAMAKDVTNINEVASQSFSDVLTYLLYMDHQRKEAELEARLSRNKH